jgi:hypothetical protein
MNAPSDPATGIAENEHGEPACAVCPHAWSDHDALGRRFCTATQVGVWSRGCICRAPAPHRSR